MAMTGNLVMAASMAESAAQEAEERAGETESARDYARANRLRAEARALWARVKAAA